MLDVEFLLDPPTTIARPLVYRYRSGVLRPAVKNTVRTIAERAGSFLSRCSPDDLPVCCSGEGLFASIAFCDLPRTVGGARSTAFALTKANRPAAVFISDKHPIFKQDEWPEVETACFVIDEAMVSRTTVRPILEYLVSEGRIAKPDLLAQEAFQRHFIDLISEHSMELPDFQQELNRLVLLHVDPSTGSFVPDVEVSEELTGRNKLRRPLRALVERGDPLQLLDLIRGLAARFSGGRQGREIGDELCRQTQYLFMSSATPHSECKGAASAYSHSTPPNGHDHSRLVWTAVLLSRTPQLFASGVLLRNGQRDDYDVSLVNVDQIGREFLRRVSVGIGDDPLSGLWSDLEKLSQNCRSDQAERRTERDKLADLLLSSLQQTQPGAPRWVKRLQLMSSSVSESVAPQQECRATAREQKQHILNSPHCLDQIIGRRTVVEGLKGRIADKENGVPILLYGPEGIGKRTLARLYAKGLLCEGEGTASSCECGSCKRFHSGSLFGLIELDACASFASDYVQRRLLREVCCMSLAPYTAVIVSNADKAPRILEMCLKTLEAQSKEVRFVLTATNLESLSAAGQSRCDVYRLTPLAESEALQLTRRFFAQPRISYDERILDLIAGHAYGLPGRLGELCRVVAENNCAALNEARQALDLAWGEQAVRYWRALLVREIDEASCLALPDGWPPQKSASRVRSILTDVYRIRGGGCSLQPALMHLGAEPILELASLLHERAAELGCAFHDLWDALSNTWTTNAQGGPIAFLQTGSACRDIILGREPLKIERVPLRSGI